MADRISISPVPLTVLCGFDRHAVADATAALLLSTQRLAVVYADPMTADLGYVQTRVTDSEGRCTERTYPLLHDCLPCALRTATVDAVRGLWRTDRYDAILIHLPPGIEADAAIEALAAELTGIALIDTVGLMLHPGWIDDLCGNATLAERGIAVTGDDDRDAATVLAANLTAATAVVLPDRVHGRDEDADADALLGVLAAGATRMRPATPYDVIATDLVRTGRFDPAMLDPLAVRGLLDPEQRLPADRGSLRLVRWQATTPLHPQRLHDALDGLADGVIRSTGYLRLATRPGRLVHWDSAGARLVIGPLDTDSPLPQGSHLAFLGDDLDAEQLRAVLDSCLLTDREATGGPAAWSRLPDPFPTWNTDHERRESA